MGRKLSFNHNEALALKLEGYPDTEIAARLGVEQGVISRWRRANNIPLWRRCWACSELFVAPGTGKQTHCGKCGLRKCSRCKRIKSATEFSVNQAAPDGLNNVCRACGVEKNLARTPLDRKRFGLKANWGLTLDDLLQLWKAQDGLCAICLEPVELEKVRIDHDARHHPGRPERGCRECIRGLAHHGCNVGIGFFRENPRALRSAADYLERVNGMGEGEAFPRPPHPRL